MPKYMYTYMYKCLLSGTLECVGKEQLICFMLKSTLNGSNGSNAETSEAFPENKLAPPPEKNGSLLLPEVDTENAENRSLPPPPPPATELVEANGSSFLSSLAPPTAPPTPPLVLAATASEEEDCVLSSPPSSRWELVLKPLILLTGLLEPAWREGERERERKGGERERERERVIIHLNLNSTYSNNKN